MWKGFDGTPIFSCPGHIERYHLRILVLVLVRKILFVSCRKFCLSCWKSFVYLFLEKVVSVCFVVNFFALFVLLESFSCFLRELWLPVLLKILSVFSGVSISVVASVELRQKGVR